MIIIIQFNSMQNIINGILLETYVFQRKVLKNISIILVDYTITCFSIKNFFISCLCENFHVFLSIKGS